MMNVSAPIVVPEVVQLIAEIHLEQQNFKPEVRIAKREPAVIPATVEFADDNWTVDAITRNVSPQGACLIAPEPFRANSQASIRLKSQFGQAMHGSCRWNKKFSTSYWISGWKLEQPWPVDQLSAEDQSIEPERSPENCLRTAIPVMIHQDQQPNRVPCFSRNLTQDGISLIGKIAVAPKHVGLLEFTRCSRQSNVLVSRCIWTKPWNDHWVSGWKFLECIR